MVSAITACGGVALGADRGGDDVGAVLAERRADEADHPGLVRVAEDDDVVGERQVEVLAPGADEVGVVARPDAGAGDLDGLAAGLDPDRDQLREVGRDACRCVSTRSMPRASATVGALTRLTGSSVWPERMPTSVEIAEQAGVVLGEPPADLDLDPLDGAVAEPLGEAAELLAERDEGRQRLHRLRADRGDVDRVGDDAAGQGGDDLLGGDDPGSILGLGGRSPEVRGDDDVVAA